MVYQIPMYKLEELEEIRIFSEIYEENITLPNSPQILKLNGYETAMVVVEFDEDIKCASKINEVIAMETESLFQLQKQHLSLKLHKTKILSTLRLELGSQEI